MGFAIKKVALSRDNKPTSPLILESEATLSGENMLRLVKGILIPQIIDFVQKETNSPSEIGFQLKLTSSQGKTTIVFCFLTKISDSTCLGLRLNPKAPLNIANPEDSVCIRVDDMNFYSNDFVELVSDVVDKLLNGTAESLPNTESRFFNFGTGSNG